MKKKLKGKKVALRGLDEWALDRFTSRCSQKFGRGAPGNHDSVRKLTGCGRSSSLAPIRCARPDEPFRRAIWRRLVSRLTESPKSGLPIADRQYSSDCRHSQPFAGVLRAAARPGGRDVYQALHK